MSSVIYDGPWTLASVIDDRAERLGDAPAVTGERDLTYGQLRSEAARLAQMDRPHLLRLLRRHGLR